MYIHINIYIYIHIYTYIYICVCVCVCVCFKKILIVKFYLAYLLLIALLLDDYTKYSF